MSDTDTPVLEPMVEEEAPRPEARPINWKRIFGIIFILALIGACLAFVFLAPQAQGLRDGATSMLGGNTSTADEDNDGKGGPAAEPTAAPTVAPVDPEKRPEHVFNILLEKHQPDGKDPIRIFAWSTAGQFNADVFKKTAAGYSVTFTANATVWFDPAFPTNWQYRTVSNGGQTTNASTSWVPLSKAKAGDGYAIWLEQGGTVEFRFVLDK